MKNSFCLPLIFLLVASLAIGGCATRRRLERGDQLMASGQAQAAVAVLEQGLSEDPQNPEIQKHLDQARREAQAQAFRQAQRALQAAQFRLAWDALTQARQQAFALHDNPQQARIDELQRTLINAARQHVAALIKQGDAHGDYAAAVHLTDWLPVETQQAELVAWAKQTRARIAAGHRRLASERVAAHPGSAALHWSMARGLDGERSSDAALLRAWQRFVQPVCYAEPEVEVHDASNTPDEFPSQLRDVALTQLQSFRARCGNGVVPLRVHVLVDGVETIDQSAKAPAAVARPGLQLRTEEVVQLQEHVRTTQEATVYENRVITVAHQDCPAPSKCRNWSEQVRKKLPVRRLQVVEGSHAVEHRRLLEGLPEDQIVRFERVTVTRRVTSHGRIAVDNAAFTSLPFAATAESSDSGHPEVVREDAVLGADPLDVRDLPSLTQEAAGRAAEMVQMAAQEAAWDRAQAYADQAAQAQGTQPDVAEEAYLSMLALGLDGGEPVREFFAQRYGQPASVVLGHLGQALGAAPTGLEEAAADLTLLFPRHSSNTQTSGNVLPKGNK